MASPLAAEQSVIEARRWSLVGRVQGVGFRPFVYRLATRFNTLGWVSNQGGRVVAHVEGSCTDLELFKATLRATLPPGAAIVGFDEIKTSAEGFTDFSIRPSAEVASTDCFPPADLCVCDDCLLEMRDPQSRRFRYPFINCAQCGPRYTLLQAMPYDRRNTTMSQFQLCPDCLTEYADPLDRRFHAQPLACPVCGPQLSWKKGQQTVQGNEPSLLAAVDALRGGLTIAVKGVGGYHLLCDARSSVAVNELRRRKNRPAKPLALLVPFVGLRGLDFAHEIANLSVEEENALLQPDRPIVIVQGRGSHHIAAQMAPDLHEIGIMLPCSPLLHLLLDEFNGPLVATSGNISGEPLIAEPLAAETQLRDIASAFLHHNRAITRACDDSVVRVVARRIRPVRLGRGCSPLELRLAYPIACPTIALGALQKNTIALAWDDRVAISQHIGDYTSVGGRDRLVAGIADLESLYRVSAQRIVLDAHPAMQARHLERHAGMPVARIWHHFAHAGAVAGEYPDQADMLCFTWDANGYGQDGTLWGGEALIGRPGEWTRMASFRPFPLIGGGAAAAEPWRSALGLCWEAGLQWSKETSFATPALRLAYEQHINCPTTSAVGRLFDAAAALLGACAAATFSAQAAMRLEAICPPLLDFASAIPLSLTSDETGVLRADWQPLLEVLLDDDRSVASRAQTFHATLALTLCDQARAIRQRTGLSTVGLAGGVFQNRILAELVQSMLVREGFQVRFPSLMPVNDAAISFGQIIEVAAKRCSPATRREPTAEAWFS